MRESLLELRQLLVHKLLTLKLFDMILRALSNEETNTSAIEDDTIRLQLLVTAHHGIGVNTHRFPHLSPPDYTLHLCPLTREDAHCDKLIYLSPYRLLFCKLYHNLPLYLSALQRNITQCVERHWKQAVDNLAR